MNGSVYNSLDIKKFDSFCYKLFSLEKVLSAHYEDYIDQINVAELNNVATDENNIKPSGDEKEALSQNDLQLKFYENLKNIWSSLENFVREYLNNFEDQNHVPKKYVEIQYIMISLADEIFLKKNKIISDFWKNNLLEYQFFGTRSSGSLIFDKIETLLVNNDKIHIDIAYIYLTTLSLGFKGKYSTSNNDEEIKSYKKQLYNFISKIAESNIQEDKSKFSNTLSIPWKVKEIFLPNVKKWYFYIFLCFAIYIILSPVIWYLINYDLSKKINRINQDIYEINK